MKVRVVVRKPSGTPARRAIKSGSERIGPYLCAIVVLIWMASPAIGFQGSLTVVTVLGLAGAVLGMLLPTVGLLSVGLLCTIDPITRVFLLTGGLLRWNTFNYVLLLVSVLSAPVFLRVKDVHTRLGLLLFIYCFLGLTYSSDVRNGILSLLNLGALLGLTLYYVRASRDEHIHVWVGMVNGVCAAISGVLFQIHQYSLPEINANAWSWVPLTGIFSVCMGFRGARRGSLLQVLLGTLALVNASLAFLSTSRGAMLITTACLIYLLFQTSGFAVRATVVTVGVAVASIVLVSFSERGAIAAHRAFKLFDDEYTAEERTSGRSDLAEVGVEIFLSRPLGVGTGAFKKEFSKLDLDLAVAGMERNAHSGWIMTLAENGVIGVTLLAIYILSFALQGILHRRRGLLGVGLLVSATLAVAFIAREFQGKGPWLLSAGGAALMTKMYRESKARERNYLLHAPPRQIEVSST